MNVLLIANSSAGRGRARHIVAHAQDALRVEVRRVELAQAGPHADPSRLKSMIAEADCVISIGGDGTLNHLLDLLLEAQKPVYVLPLGTENLFARHFSMFTKPNAAAPVGGGSGGGAASGGAVRGPVARLLWALRRWKVVPCDVARVNGRAMAVMASLGVDASLIHRVATGRRGPITHAAYALPALREAIAPHFARFRVEVDGRWATAWTTGGVVVANLPQYGLRLNPAADAVHDDGLLDVVVMPASTGVGAIRWALACARGRQARKRGWLHLRSANVRIVGAARRGLESQVYQVDGEAAAEPAPIQADGARTASISISVDARKLKVLDSR